MCIRDRGSPRLGPSIPTRVLSFPPPNIQQTCGSAKLELGETSVCQQESEPPPGSPPEAQVEAPSSPRLGPSPPTRMLSIPAPNIQATSGSAKRELGEAILQAQTPKRGKTDSST
eukprot:TRINITY_DN35995_c0_g2_i1.p2 TRINITY_DN35995_c0_g2~~TRINITY_DN35995_c0_g2_i1.p2  ORF type:complete len:115 (+),score=11.96 TRINITY_DN35995_c0_g2_i1:113-457(+)